MQQKSSIVERVFDFNKQIVGVDVDELTPMSPSEAEWLASAFREEGEELEGAFWEYDEGYPDTPGSEARKRVNPEDVVVDQVDACLDTAIFAIGGLARIGLTREQAEACFHAIMDANFEKKAGVKEGRSGAKDAVKPEGWVGPEARLKEILYGQR